MQTLDVPFELKASGASGKFEGYGAVFGNKDLGDDIILPGAFEEVKTTSDGMLRIALYHDLWQLAGKARFTQDDHGLHIDGQMNLNVSYAKDAYELMKDGTLDGMSVGFNILPGGSAWESHGDEAVRIISKAELWEVSIVPFGMNPEAKIDSVKEAFSVRSFEKFLRGEGHSKKEAVAMASCLQKLVQRDAGTSLDGLGDPGTITGEMLGDLKHAISQFNIN